MPGVARKPARELVCLASSERVFALQFAACNKKFFLLPSLFFFSFFFFFFFLFFAASNAIFFPFCTYKMLASECLRD